MHRRSWLVLLMVTVGISALVATSPDDIVLWPEHQRSFLQDGPALLLSEEAREKFLSASSDGRDRIIDQFFDHDPDPDTPENELLLAIKRRQDLVHQDFLTLLDQRAMLLFLLGPPTERDEIECGMTFKPLEIWTYGEGGSAFDLVLYRRRPDDPFRIWLPIESKRPLYIREMVHWLETYEELKGRFIGKRFDLQTCPKTKKVDKVTGVDGIFGFRPGRPTNKDILKYIAPPADRDDWVRSALTTPLEKEPTELLLGNFDILFPDRLRQRMITRFLIAVPPEAGLEPSAESEKPELILSVDGLIVQEDKLFDEFKVRFKLDPPEEAVHIALALERALRPEHDFIVHLRVTDEVSGAESYLHRSFTVPSEPEVIEEPPVPEGTIIAMGEMLAREVVAGHDSLLLVPPQEDVVLGLWRAEALVTGSRIHKVAFMVDGQVQMSRTARPFTAELRLAQFPKEQVIRAEGYDQSGELVASDEVVLNQPRGSLRVRIVEPRRGVAVSGRIVSKAEVTVPEERRIEEVEFLVNESSVVKLRRPPWETAIEVPATGEMAYLTVVATLDDGTRSEEVRFLNAPQFLEEVEVNLIELYTTVMDGSGRLVRGLVKEEFEVREDDRPQTIAKFELVENLPLTVGFTIDTSGSMVDALPKAREAAIGFLKNILTPRDRAFAVSFADGPVLLIPLTDDVDAVEESLEDLRSVGWTTLHDAVVTSLYYFRGIKGRRALILLSDGDDTASSIPFRDALEYARRSGVAIFSIGIDVGKLEVSVRRKLTNLSKETGGRVFFISDAAQLVDVYQEIEDELRSQYLVAYNSDQAGGEGDYRTVEVKVRKGKLKARTISGYYP